jgi:hypothetical protein
MQEILPLVTPEVQQLDGAAHLQRLEKRMEHLKRAIHDGSPHGNDKMGKPKSVMLSQRSPTRASAFFRITSRRISCSTSVEIQIRKRPK